MRNTAKSQAVALESASALSTDDFECVEPIIAVWEGDRLTPMSIKEATTRYENPSLYLLDKHTLNQVNPSKSGLRNQVRSTLRRFLWKSYAKYSILDGLQIKVLPFILALFPEGLLINASAAGYLPVWAPIALGVGIFLPIDHLIQVPIWSKFFKKQGKRLQESLAAEGVKFFQPSILRTFDGTKLSIARPSLTTFTHAISALQELNETHLSRMSEYKKSAELSAKDPLNAELYAKMTAERPEFEALLAEYKERIAEIQELLAREEV